MSNSENVVCVGLDDGHDHIKVYLGKNPLSGVPMQFKMQSRAAVGQSNMGDDDFVNEELVVVGNNLYTVSEMLNNYSDTRFDDYPTSPLSKALVYQALRLAFKEFNIEENILNITSGLPVDRFYNTHNRTKNSDLIAAKKETLLGMSDVYNMFDQKTGKPSLKIDKHSVLCEANAAYYDVIFEETLDGNTSGVPEITDLAMETGIFEGGAAVLDIGGRTTDCVVVNPYGKNLNAARSGTVNAGIISFQDEVRGQLKQNFQLSFISEKSLKEAIITGIYKVGSKELEIADIVNKAKENLFKLIENFMNTTVGDGSDLPAIILVGGGGYVLKDHVMQKYPNIIIPEDPEFANARGFYKILKYIV